MSVLHETNVCPRCNRPVLVIEYFGQYGDIFKLKRNGDAYSERVKRVVYESTGDAMIYCSECGHVVEELDDN